MNVVEQMKDEYGNLIQLWGVYELEEKHLIKEALAFPVKSQTKKLLRSFASLNAANFYLNNVLEHKITS